MTGERDDVKMVAWAVLPQYVFRSSCFKCFQDATHSNLRSCPYVVNLIKSILLLPHMWFNIKTNKALQCANVSKKTKKQNPILRPKNPILFHDRTNFLTQTSPSCLMSMNIEQNPPSLSLQRSDILNLSTSVSPLALLLPESFKRTEKEKGSVTAQYTRADIQYFSYVIFHFCLMDTNG